MPYVYYIKYSQLKYYKNYFQQVAALFPRHILFFSFVTALPAVAKGNAVTTNLRALKGKVAYRKRSMNSSSHI